MIVINKDQSNNIILTLRENTTIQEPYFLFEFISRDKLTTKMFISEDISLNTCRYNQFNIVENEIEDILNGTINLGGGFYDYNVYQQDNDSNLNKDNTDKILEQGIVYVKGDYNDVKTTYNDNDDNEYISYQ